MISNQAKLNEELLGELRELKDAVNMVAMECEARAMKQGDTMEGFRVELERILAGQDH